MDTTNFFLMNPLSPATVKYSWTERNDILTGIFGNEAQLQGESTEPDFNMILTSTTDFGPESYQTPHRSVRNSMLFLDPPPPPHK